MKYKFTTDRLMVFTSRMEFDDDIREPRMMYVGFLKDEDYVAPVIHVTIQRNPVPVGSFSGSPVEWIWTHEKFRRQGFARELCKAIEDRIGDLIIDGVTPEGEAFAEAMNGEG